jgi:hypothetical protein
MMDMALKDRRWAKDGEGARDRKRGRKVRWRERTRSRTNTFFFLPSNRNLSCLSDSWSTSFSTFVLFRRLTIALSRVWTWTGISICPLLSGGRRYEQKWHDGDDWDGKEDRSTYLSWLFYRYEKTLDLLPYLLISGLSAIPSDFWAAVVHRKEVVGWWDLLLGSWMVYRWSGHQFYILYFEDEIERDVRGHTVILSFLLPTISTNPNPNVRRWSKRWEGRHTFNTISFDQLSSIID